MASGTLTEAFAVQSEMQLAVVLKIVTHTQSAHAAYT